MRKLGSILVITLLLIAYGRCVADQFGMLDGTENACCGAPSVETAKELAPTHCDHSDDVEHQHHDFSSSPTPHPSEPPADKKTPPCQLCVLLSMDSMLLSAGVDVPTPSITDFHVDFFTLESIPALFITSQLSSEEDISPVPHEEMEDESPLERLLVASVSVRGPNTH